MLNLPTILRYVITGASLFIVLTQTQTQDALLWQKIVFVVLTILAAEWLFYFIPYLKRETK